MHDSWAILVHSPVFSNHVVRNAALMLRRAGGILGIGCIGAIAANIVTAANEPWEASGDANAILRAPNWPARFPLSAKHLSRADETADGQFYAHARMVQHIDDHAVASLKRHYRQTLPKGGAVLDLMSSWTSHLEDGAGASTADGWFSRVSAIGMNADELRANPALHDYHVQDLNLSPSLRMYADETFDAVFCSVSVDCPCARRTRTAAPLCASAARSREPCATHPTRCRSERPPRRVRRDTTRSEARRAGRLHVVESHVPHKGDRGVALGLGASEAVDLRLILPLRGRLHATGGRGHLTLSGAKRPRLRRQRPAQGRPQ